MATQSDRFMRPADDAPGSAPTETQIAQWEEENDKRLSNDYRTFMLKYNGGFVFPEAFPTSYPENHPVYDEMDELTDMNGFFHWTEFIEQNAFNVFWNKREYVSIGTAVAGEILLRTADPEFGSIHLWWHHNEPWDYLEEPGTTAKLASSFRSFVEDVLREEGRSPHWHHPKFLKDAQKIEF